MNVLALCAAQISRTESDAKILLTRIKRRALFLRSVCAAQVLRPTANRLLTHDSAGAEFCAARRVPVWAGLHELVLQLARSLRGAMNYSVAIHQGAENRREHQIIHIKLTNATLPV